jgi:hypothetical protein
MDMKVLGLEEQMRKLLERVQGLERAQAPAPAAPPRNNALRRAEGAKLRASIERILTTHPEYSAKHVLKALAAVDFGRQTLPSVRAVQWHITALRNTPPVLRSAHIPQ